MNLGKGKQMRTLSQQELKESLHYNPETGVFTWLRLHQRIKIGSAAGCLCKKSGYITIGINGKTYQAHRLAWLYMKGVMPDDLIDHENGNPSDNRFCNLRKATHAENMQNQNKPQSNNTTGFLGVTFNKRSGKYQAQIRIKSRQNNLGFFDSPEEAHKAYLAAKRKNHEFSTI